ncbi:hypothetical protein K458DRAFT_488312 [Lentithecium fluviatile CBS 122367]|uniref:Uncharacterized protein n=1 Tax=Lentithecium fluviatile CBS 122367 TaxID=1168545 RepID=A0A6G1IY32_9PLEO|nr:hypothetical protein K458DRAFT_488312 [Lentithecium fluviatile CBS 122367]
MHATALFLGAVAATTIANPIRKNRYVWEPAPGSTPSCDASSDKYLPISNASFIATVACERMMPPCAHPYLLPNGTVCIQSDWPLNETKTVSLNETVMSTGATVASGWTAELTVTPATLDARWFTGDCHGYFGQLLSQPAPEGCSTGGTGAGAGTITVGDNASLEGTVFSVSFAEGA